MDNIKEISIIVKWSGKEYSINDLNDFDTVAVLKHEIFKKTSVKPERQKLLNLKHKGRPLYFQSYEFLKFISFFLR